MPAARRTGGLEVPVTADVRKFRRNMGLATRQLTTIRDAGEKAAIAIAAMGAAFAARAVTQATDLASAMVENARVAGISVEQYQRLGRVLEGEGISARQFRTGLIALTRRMGEARAGNEVYAESFRRLGVDMGATAGEAIYQVADGLAAIADQGERLRVAQNIGSEIFRRWVPALSDGADALQRAEEELAAFGILAQGEAERLKAFGQEMTNAGNLIQTVFAKAVADALPQLNELQDLVVGVGEGPLRGVTRGLTAFVRTVAQVAQTISENFGAFQAFFLVYFGARRAADIARFATGLGALATSYRGVKAATDAATASQLAWNTAFRANPIGLLVTIVAQLAAAVFIYRQFRDANDDAAESMRRVVRGSDEQFAALADLEGQWERLTEAERKYGQVAVLAPVQATLLREQDTLKRLRAEYERLDAQVANRRTGGAATRRLNELEGEIEKQVSVVVAADLQFQKLAERLGELGGAEAAAAGPVGQLNEALRLQEERAKALPEVIYRGFREFSGLLESGALALSARPLELFSAESIRESARRTLEQWREAIERERETLGRGLVQPTGAASASQFGPLIQAVPPVFGPVIAGMNNPVLTGEPPDYTRWQEALQGLGRLGEGVFGEINRTLEQAIVNSDGWADSLEKVGRVLAARAFANLGSRFLLPLLGLPPARLPGRQYGGPVQAGRPYLVGEREPELFVPQAAGRVVPLRGGGLGGPAVIQTVNVTYAPQAGAGPVGSQADLARFRAEMRNIARDELLPVYRDLRAGYQRKGSR